MGLTWHGAERAREIRDDGKRRLGLALRDLKNYAREHLSEVATILAIAGAEGINGNRRERRVAQAAEPSAPGEFPHKRTGLLRRSVDLEIYPDGLAGRYGTNVPYGKHLETGTRKMAPRPWMSLTNAARGWFVRKLLTGKMD